MRRSCPQRGKIIIKIIERNMFSGIVERMATVVAIREERQNKTFTLRSEIAGELKIDQSISHNGV